MEIIKLAAASDAGFEYTQVGIFCRVRYVFLPKLVQTFGFVVVKSEEVGVGVKGVHKRPGDIRFTCEA